ncbi:MAG TPA: phosphoribosylglycinamide formyltransferase [Usitatibacteraceae bacterium]
MKSIVILISGRGSNMEAILDAGLPLQVRAVISNRPEARGLETARNRGIPAIALDHKTHSSREAFDAALAETINRHTPDYIVLAGFMRILTADFIGQYVNRIINIHPSLLPAFTGLHTHRRAIESGVKIHGTTVHFVTPALDHGPIIIQAAVPVVPDDTEDSLTRRVLQQEHRIYPQALAWLAADRVELRNGVVRIRDLDVLPSMLAPALVVPDEA